MRFKVVTTLENLYYEDVERFDIGDNEIMIFDDSGKIIGIINKEEYIGIQKVGEIE
ncbi:hypothetical protein ACNRWW_14080 [Metabacillus sp. HB246100]